MRKATPVASFVVVRTALLFKFQVVTLNTPTVFVNECLEGRFFRQRREPVAGRFNVDPGPFDDQPFRVPSAVAVGGDYAHPGKPTGQFFR